MEKKKLGTRATGRAPIGMFGVGRNGKKRAIAVEDSYAEDRYQGVGTRDGRF